MGQPWGLSGPQFTGLYVAGYLGALVIVCVAQAMLSRLGSVAAGTDARLDDHAVAYLAGGPTRVLDTAIAGLALRGQVLVARGGTITAVRGGRPSGPVEATVYEALGRNTSRNAIHRALRDHPEITGIGDAMRSRGLLLSRPRALAWRWVLVLPVAVWVVGVVRAVNGAHLHRPIGNLTTLLVFSGVATVIVLLARLRTRHRPSPAGRLILWCRRDAYQAQGAGAPVPAQVAGVAVVGFAALNDTALRRALVPASGGGGDGGGCGGGCGGCGGCGG
jgi:uncharacterized protein (TIGR04222 family)